MVDPMIRHRDIHVDYFVMCTCNHHHPMRLLSRGALVSQGAIASMESIGKIVVRLSQS